MKIFQNVSNLTEKRPNKILDLAMRAAFRKILVENSSYEGIDAIVNDAFYKGSILCCNDVHVNFDKDVVLNSIATDGEKIFINVYNKDEYLNYYTSQGFVTEPKLHSYILEI